MESAEVKLEDTSSLDLHVSSPTGSAYDTYFGPEQGSFQESYDYVEVFEHSHTSKSKECQLLPESDVCDTTTELTETDVFSGNKLDEKTVIYCNHSNINIHPSEPKNPLGTKNEVEQNSKSRINNYKTTTRKKYKKRIAKTNRLKYALRNSDGRETRQSGNNSKTDTKVCQKSGRPKEGRSRSIVGKLVPAKNVTSIPKYKARSEMNGGFNLGDLQPSLGTSISSISQLIRSSIQDELSEKCSRTGNLSTDSKSQFIVLDPKFWNIPLQSVENMVNLPEDASLKYVSKISGCLLPVTETFEISNDIITSAVKSSKSSVVRFAMALFRKVSTVGEIYNGQAEERMGGKVINHVKLKHIRRHTFEKFPVRKDLEDFIWKHIIFGFNANIERVNSFIHRWFDLSGIIDQL